MLQWLDLRQPPIRVINSARCNINAYFAARDAADKARTGEWISKAKERITKLQDVINGLSKKKERHLARLENDGRLPVKWHTPKRLEEDIYKERTKLGKAMQDISLLELDLQDQPVVLQDELEGLTLQLEEEEDSE